MKLGSAFDGISGFPLAGMRHGIMPVWASEIEPFPIRVSEERMPIMDQSGDITKVKGDQVEPVDVLTFGSPCQDLSVAGKRAGMQHTDKGDEQTTRSGLFMEVVRIVKEMRDATSVRNTNDGRAYMDAGEATNIESGESWDRICGNSRGKNNATGTNDNVQPRFVVWENVPGAFSSNKGEDFRIVLEELAKIADQSASIPQPAKWNKAGCIMGDGWSIAWRTLDAQYWGVPQRRRRIFLVADFRGQSAPEILFKREGLRRDSQESGEAREGTPEDVERSVGAAGFVGMMGSKARSIGYANDQSPTISAEQMAHVVTTERSVGATVNLMSYGISGDETPKYGIDKTPSLRAERQGYVAFTQNQREEVRDLNDIAGALAAEPGVHQQTYVASPVYCLQGNGIDRKDTAGCNGKGWREDQAYTLNTIDRPAVVYSLDSLASNSMKSANPHSGCHVTDIAKCIDTTNPCPSKNQGGLAIVSTRLYESHPMDSRITGPIEVSPTVTAHFHKGSADTPLVEHFMIENHPADSRVKIDDSGTCQTLTTRMGTGGGNVPMALTSHMRVRRLTPLECERLQGFPDGWTDIEKASDSARYKALGNSVAVPCVEYVMQGIAEEVTK